MLDFDTLYNEAQGGAFAGGKKRFYDNKVVAPEGRREDGKLVVTARVKGAERDHDVRIVFDELGGLYDYSCDCPAFMSSDGPCKHIVAAALSYEEKNPEDSKQPPQGAPRPRTDAAVYGLITDYSKKKHLRRAAATGARVNLIPVLDIDESGRLSLKFTIGATRQYTLKDISDFVSCVQSAGYRRYGVELSFQHSLENFQPRAAELARFLVRAYTERAELALPTASRDEIRLLQNDIDNFFELYAGQLVSVTAGSASDGVRLIVPGVNALDAAVKIEKASGGFVLTMDLDAFRTVKGKRFSYIVTDSRIYKCTEEFIAAAGALLKSLTVHRRLFVAEQDMASFYNNVLQQLVGYLPVDTALDLTVFDAPPLVSGLYIDRMEGGIRCRLETSYDDQPIDILGEVYTADILRDWESETALRELLKKFFSSYPVLESVEEDEIYRFMSQGVQELIPYAEVFLSEEAARMKVRRPPRIKVGVRIASDLLSVDLSAEDLTHEELIAVIRAYREKKNYIRLSDGSFVDLSDQSIGSLSEILSVADDGAGTLTLPKYYAPFLDSELKSGFFELERSPQFKSLVKSITAASDADIEVPDPLKSVMRNYQKAGFRWMETLRRCRFGGILADDMGLGKSLQIIALLLSHKGTSVIVCPTTLILNWVGEFKKFAPGMKILPVMGTYEERKALTAKAEVYDVVITSYELLRRDEELYKDISFEFAVIDEAQFIKNPDTLSARTVKMLKSKYRFALTGTPIENSLAELWSIFDFIMPGYLYAYPRFREEFEANIVRGDEGAAKRLNKLVAPFILRRLKSGVLKELPPKVETDVVAPLEGEQKKLYAANLLLIRDSVAAAGEGFNKVVVLSMLTKLRQICCSPSLVYPDYEGNSAKLECAMSLISSATEGGHKVLLFSQFTSMLEILREKLSEAGITYYVLKGDTPKAERMRLVNRFNADETQVFLISLKAGGTGLNLTGADVVIHYDPWWNESVMNQATDRAYRIGQNRSVQVYKLILENSIEQRIMKLQEKKTALSSLVMGGSGVSVKDVMTLLSEE